MYKPNLITPVVLRPFFLQVTRAHLMQDADLVQFYTVLYNSVLPS